MKASSQEQAARSPEPTQPDDVEEPKAVAPSGVVPRHANVARAVRAGVVLRSVRVYDALAEAAHQHVALGEREDALRTIDDAVELLEGVRDRRPFARVLVGIGECLVELGCRVRAEPLLEEALLHAEALPDVPLAARARRLLASLSVPPPPQSEEVLDALREAMDEEVPSTQDDPSRPGRRAR